MNKLLAIILIVLTVFLTNCSTPSNPVSQSNAILYNAKDTTQTKATPGADTETLQLATSISNQENEIDEYSDPAERFEFSSEIYQDALVVRKVQEELQLRGYDIGQVDGMMGPKTQTALSDFQRQQGILITDGEIDKQTLDALDLELIPSEELSPNEIYAE